MSIDPIATLTFILISTFTPGPNNISSAAMGALHGYRKSLNYLFGITVGFFLVMFACAWISTSFVDLLPQFEPYLRYIGVAYTLYLAFGILKASYSFSNENIAPLGFTAGFLLQLLNPKLVIYGLTLFSTFLVTLKDLFLQFIMVLGLTVISLCAISTWALFGSIIKRFLHHPRARLTLNIILALFLVYTALELARIL
jgi:cysteine/O-acetylserine efflux protein